ncbi:NAD(P)/FAD-dependent oxidoreductase [Cohnella cellulosilytica]|uniref:NAD(P)/FAD-dependent oxidoreductase n=1 Tax=Cohnella cellulosilytica TaxID=986710 RepID=A0ABW2F8Q6_9BACL
MSFDAIVVGARVAGASLAYYLAKAGCKVLLLDRATFPSDTLSTHNMFGNSLGMLREMGVLEAVLRTNTRIYRRGHVHFDGAVIDGLFPETNGIQGNLCVRRKYLDHILFEHAANQPGVTAIEGFKVTSLIRENGAVAGVEGRRRDGEGRTESFRARLVVGADGRLSKIREWVGSERKISLPTDYASYTGYVSGFRQEGEAHVEFYKNGDKIAILFPTSDDQFVVGGMFPLVDFPRIARFKADPEAGFRELIEDGFAHTTLAERFGDTRFVEPIRGLHGYDNDWYVGMGEGWALLGDALTFKDPCVGQGMHDALFGARLLADILSRHAPEEWRSNAASMGEAYQSAMEEKLMSRFWLGCQFTKNVPVPEEMTAAYRLIGADRQATETFLGMYNYSSEPEDIQAEIGRLLAAAQEGARSPA